MVGAVIMPRWRAEGAQWIAVMAGLPTSLTLTTRRLRCHAIIRRPATQALVASGVVRKNIMLKPGAVTYPMFFD
jgi:hypothetical protein